MTHEPDIERALVRWLGEDPARMPDGFLDRMVDRIETVPQSRLARSRSRALTFAQTLDRRLVAAALAMVVIVGLVGGTVLSRLPAVGVLASPSPSVVPTASPSTDPSASVQVVVDITQLQATWNSVGTRPIPYGGLANIVTTLVIGPGTVKVGEVGGESLNEVALIGPDRLEITSETAPHQTGLKCNLGDRGTYVSSLSESGRLTLTLIGDACPTRAAVVTGEWEHTNLGPLTPGRHLSIPFRPFGAGTTGSLSYAVPTGWTEQDENQTYFAIFGPDPAVLAWVSVSSGVLPPVADTGCGPAPADVGHSPLVVAAWLATLPGLAVTQPTPVTIGGLNGVMVDVSVAGTGTQPCVGPLSPVAGGGTRKRYILLDRGSGQTLLVDIEGQDAATWPAVLAAGMSVVNTFEFSR